ncbi:hypothetical protein T492DRAFT_1151220 [Pavlovales sp. CCMP2436]|nr:hypothetical protein T492DRAFT_1151220 [Pavlovales sp. CCMP2436]
MNALMTHLHMSATCAHCGASERKLLRYGSCGVAWYCSVEHQRAHWKAGHKLACRSAKPLTTEDAVTMRIRLDGARAEMLESAHALYIATGWSPAQVAAADAEMRVRAEQETQTQGVRCGVVADAPQATATAQAKPLHSGTNAFEWDPHVWQISAPAFFAHGLGMGCMQGETTGCSVQSFDETRREVSVRILVAGRDMGIGVCCKKRGKLGDFWKFSANGSKFFSGGTGNFGYGRPFGAGDVVTVRLAKDSLSFAINGVCHGVAFEGYAPEQGPYYLRMYLSNLFSVKTEWNAKILRRRQLHRGGSMSKEALDTLLNNVGSPTASDLITGRAEVVILAPGE